MQETHRVVCKRRAPEGSQKQPPCALQAAGEPRTPAADLPVMSLLKQVAVQAEAEQCSSTCQPTARVHCLGGAWRETLHDFSLQRRGCAPSTCVTVRLHALAQSD